MSYSINAESVRRQAVEIFINFEIAINSGNDREVRASWRELMDFRATISAIEPPPQPLTEQLEGYIQQLQPAYDFWCTNHPVH